MGDPSAEARPHGSCPRATPLPLSRLAGGWALGSCVMTLHALAMRLYPLSHGDYWLRLGRHEGSQGAARAAWRCWTSFGLSGRQGRGTMGATSARATTLPAGDECVVEGQCAASIATEPSSCRLGVSRRCVAHACDLPVWSCPIGGGRLGGVSRATG